MNEYNKQTNDFLVATKTTMIISKSMIQTKPLWAKTGEKHGFDYNIRVKNSKSCYDFHFWDSIHNKENNEKPTNYDVLACLCPLYEKNFEDFCSAFGYDEDSIKALKTFESCKEQDKELKKLFSRGQLKLLENIQ